MAITPSCYGIVNYYLLLVNGGATDRCENNEEDNDIPRYVERSIAAGDAVG